MAEYHRVGDPQLCEYYGYYFRLGVRRSYDVARPIAVSIARTVEHDDTVIFRYEIDETAGFEILDHAAVSAMYRFNRAADTKPATATPRRYRE
jgi:hypothetical protein